MSRPLLTKVLADALLQTFCWDRRPEAVGKDTEVVIAAIPPDIADRLERALDVCAVCGFSVSPDKHTESEDVARSAGYSHHPYRPLVTP
jgi:hypothetical protein